MSDTARIRQVGRERLGGVAFTAFRELGLLARLLLPDEQVGAMALGRLRGEGWVGATRLAVATSRRLLVVEKGLLTGRERIREVAWHELRGVEVPGVGRLRLLLHDGELELSWVQPPRQLGALVDVARAQLVPDRAATTSDELLDLARRKLGKLLRFSVEYLVVGLAAALDDDEAALDVAYVGKGGDGLLAATTRGILLLRARRATFDPLIVRRFDETTGAHFFGEEGILLTGKEDLRIEGLAPEGVREAFVLLGRARARG